ncbi:MAG: polysaccharide biosynthesis C-terminal domain-containing protein [Acidobacteria bacterium]|nr:polysaccharide biosynthesis C-terminal domain-containing protein [Acidobacteriota bacterium]
MSRNMVANLARAAAVSAVAILLPFYLTHHISVTVYAAWVLILQLGAYVSYLDLGIQMGVSKFVAEYDAKGELFEAGRYASAGMRLMVLAGVLGVALTVALAWQIPRLFAAMPANLFPQVRISLILVGFSLSLALVCSVYSAVFLGLQRYWVPTLITIVNRVLFAGAIIAVVHGGGNLATMALAVALVNVLTGLLQVLAWRKGASHVFVSPVFVDLHILKKVARFCSLLSISTIAMLCIAGLDVVIVGHFDYLQTAYYSIATLPTSFLLLIDSSLLSPLMPASSALSTRLSPSQMGMLLARITRYNTIALLLAGLPLVVFAFPILRLWVGSEYASHTVAYLRILVLANIVRNLCAPYATLITATGSLKSVTAAAVSEAIVNLGSSLYLAWRFGAIGVACGTVIGAFISVFVHFAISMRLTRPVISISRKRLLRAIAGPLIVCLPSLLILLRSWPATNLHLMSAISIVWVLCTLIPAYFCLNREERQNLSRLVLPFMRQYPGTIFSCR